MLFEPFRSNKFLLGALLASAIGGGGLAAAQPNNAAPAAGTYTGTTQLLVDKAPDCSPGGPVTLQVQDGRFRFPWYEPSAFHVTISPDGSFYATSGSLAQSDKRMMDVPTMRGQASGTMIVADYGTRWCRYRLEASRS
jgi:hypothetical protein